MRRLNIKVQGKQSTTKISFFFVLTEQTPFVPAEFCSDGVKPEKKLRADHKSC